MAKSTHTDIRTSWYAKPAGFLVWLFVRLISLTIRYRIHYADEAERALAGKERRIIALWHNRTLVPCYVYRNLLRATTPMSMITSASKDGAFLTAVANRFGMQTLRGSTNRRSVAVFIGMCKAVKRGSSMCIALDGPKGPLYKGSSGIARLASMTGVPITAIAFQYSSYWRINKAWDKFIIPKPFSRIDIRWSRPIHVPADLDEEQLQDYVEQARAELSHGTPDFPAFEAHERIMPARD